MSRRKSDKMRAEALRLVAAGLTTREVAAQLRKRWPREGCSEAWVRKAVKESAEAPASEREPAVEVAPESPPLRPAPAPAPAPEDVYEHTRTQLATAIQRAQEASADGNHTAAQRFSKQIVDYTLLLARLDKERRGDTDVITIPRADLERARHALRDRVAALASDLARTGGLVCNHCGREVRIAIAKGEIK